MNDLISVKNLNLWYGAHQALHDVNLDIPEKSASRRSAARPAAASRPF